jgi:hypothetical protein
MTTAPVSLTTPAAYTTHRNAKGETAVKKFLLTHCYYDPDDYHGYLLWTIEADSMEQARRYAEDFVRDRYVRGPVEVRVWEIADSSFYELVELKRETA